MAGLIGAKGEGDSPNPSMIWSPSLQSLAERLRRLPGLFVADVSMAYGGADVFVAEELLDFTKVLSDVPEEDFGRRMAQTVSGNLRPPPIALQAAEAAG
jgi:hypothetical protein